MSKTLVEPLRKVVLLAIVVALAACGNPIGQRYKDVDSIGMSQAWSDWVIVGNFGAKGPFTLVDVKYCDVSEPCNFSHNGQGHTYDRFVGFKLAVLRLEGEENGVSHIVLRSLEKIE